MFGRHILAMILMVTFIVIGIILAVSDSWKTGLIVGVIGVGASWLLAAINMYASFRSESKGLFPLTVEP